jgi:hypothetical protein
MDIKTIPYLEAVERLPGEGNHILASFQDECIVVYQAFQPSIADYAVRHQAFGGPNYSYNRMSWIKTSFLWMMFRSGWAEKEGQERILAISLHCGDFDKILEQSVLSSYNKHAYGNESRWKEELDTKEVRLQWDPDHDPFGNKVIRRAIQLGLKEEILKQFGTNFIRKIEDITSFVKEQGDYVRSRQLDKLLVPEETVYIPSSESVRQRIGLTVDFK